MMTLRLLAVVSILLTLAVGFNNCAGSNYATYDGAPAAISTNNSNPGTGSTPGTGFSVNIGGKTTLVTSSASAKGSFEKIDKNLVYGWACLVGSDEAPFVRIKVGSAAYEIEPNLDSETQLQASNLCNNKRTTQRFVAALPVEVSGQSVIISVLDRKRSSAMPLIGPTDSKFASDLFWFYRLPTGAQLVKQSPRLPASELVGVWEGLKKSSAGYQVWGWACVKGNSEKIQLAARAANGTFLDKFGTVYQFRDSDDKAAIHKSCGAYALARRFNYTIPAAKVGSVTGESMILSLTEPLVDGIYYGSLSGGPQKVLGANDSAPSDNLLDVPVFTPSTSSSATYLPTTTTGSSSGGPSSVNVCNASLTSVSCTPWYRREVRTRTYKDPETNAVTKITLEVAPERDKRDPIQRFFIRLNPDGRTEAGKLAVMSLKYYSSSANEVKRISNFAGPSETIIYQGTPDGAGTSYEVRVKGRNLLCQNNANQFDYIGELSCRAFEPQPCSEWTSGYSCKDDYNN